jgi:hypothetical protein
VLHTDTGIYAWFVLTIVAEEDRSRAIWPSCPAPGPWRRLGRCLSLSHTHTHTLSLSVSLSRVPPPRARTHVHTDMWATNPFAGWTAGVEKLTSRPNGSPLGLMPRAVHPDSVVRHAPVRDTPPPAHALTADCSFQQVCLAWHGLAITLPSPSALNGRIVCSGPLMFLSLHACLSFQSF